MIIMTTNGRLPRPAFMGDQPRAYWKCRISMNIAAIMATELPSWASAAPRTAGRVRTARSIMGCAARRSRAMNTTTARAAPTKQARVTGDVHPLSTPLVSA